MLWFLLHMQHNIDIEPPVAVVKTVCEIYSIQTGVVSYSDLLENTKWTYEREKIISLASPHVVRNCR